MKLDRLLSIVMVMLERRSMSARDLSDMFEVSQRTIYRDIAAINQAGIPIASTSGPGGGFRLVDTYKIDRRLFTAADIAVLSMGLDSIASVLDGDRAANALAKVRSLVSRERLAEVDMHGGWLEVDLTPWRGNRELMPRLELLRTAIRGATLVAFQYAGRDGGRGARTVEPHRLILKEQHWYLSAYCLDRRAFRLFKLTRMSDVRALEDAFTPRPVPEERGSFAAGMEARLKPIVLSIHESIKDRVLDHCSASDMAADGPDRYRVDFPFIADEYGYALLLGWGDRCECLAPPEVRDELRRRIERMARVYAEPAPDGSK